MTDLVRSGLPPLRAERVVFGVGGDQPFHPAVTERADQNSLRR
jgi:hypothetical protein